MRELIFRAWDHEEAKFYQFSLKDYMSMNESGQEDLCPCKLRDSLQQSSGMKDKNDVEVFEGDLIKVMDEIHEVKFEIGGFMAGDGFLDDYWNLNGHMFDVIGNIYETPEIRPKDEE